MPWVTVTVQEAVVPLPSASVAVMVAVPTDTAVTVPLSDTVATISSLEVQVREPPAGEAFNWEVEPARTRVDYEGVRGREGVSGGEETGR